VAGRRARTGRGWDAAPPRARRARPAGAVEPDGHVGTAGADGGATAEKGARSKPPQPPRDPYEQAREICLRLLSFRPRTRAELAAALRKHEIADDVAGSVLERYTEVGIIDDAAFAKAWVTSRHHGRGLAARALAGELRRKGVDSDVVSDALDSLDGDTEAATARALVDRKLRSLESAPPDVAFRRLVAMLARKGYPSGVVIGAVKAALAERAAAEDLDVDLLADEADLEALE
jgi:regulatory protein